MELNRLKTLLAVLAIGAMSAFAVGCGDENGDGDDLGDQIEQTADDAADDIDEASDDIGGELKDNDKGDNVDKGDQKK